MRVAAARLSAQAPNKAIRVSTSASGSCQPPNGRPAVRGACSSAALVCSAVHCAHTPLPNLSDRPLTVAGWAAAGERAATAAYRRRAAARVQSRRSSKDYDQDYVEFDDEEDWEQTVRQSGEVAEGLAALLHSCEHSRPAACIPTACTPPFAHAPLLFISPRVPALIGDLHPGPRAWTYSEHCVARRGSCRGPTDGCGTAGGCLHLPPATAACFCCSCGLLLLHLRLMCAVRPPVCCAF